MLGKKLVIGALIFLLLILIGSVAKTLDNPLAVLVFWILAVFFIVLLNNVLCRKWLSFDKLQIYKYSWRQFGIILIILLITYSSRTNQTLTYLEKFPGACAFYIFFGYLLFYLGDRYVKRRFLNVALKSIPFVTLFFLLLIGFASVSGTFQPTKPKTITYMDVLSGDVFRISAEDIEKEITILSEFAKIRQNLYSYQDILDGYLEGTVDYETFVKETSRIEGAWHVRMKNMERLAQEIKSTFFKELLLRMINLEKNDLFAIVKIKEGAEKLDSTAVQIGMELIKENDSKRVQLVTTYSSIIRVEPGDQVEEQRSIGRLRVEITKIHNNLDEYELAFQDFCYEDLSLKDFKQKVSSYESALKDCFQKCDSVMECIRSPEALGFLEKYVNYNNIYGSIPYQRFQALSSLAEAYIDYDSDAYSVNYTKYIDLTEKSEAFVNDFLSNFLQE